MKKNILLTLIANVFYLILSAISSFLIPKMIPVAEYASYKSYLFYLYYCGLLHFGYNDGMYLKYGGKAISPNVSPLLGNEIRSGLILQLIIAAPMTMYGIFTKNENLIWLAFGMVGTNMCYMFKSLYQATGEMAYYGVVINLEKFLPLIAQVIMIVFFGVRDAKLLIVSYVITLMTVFVVDILIIQKRKISVFATNHFMVLIRDNIHNGFVLMLGNFANTLFTGIDRWFVKLFLLDYHFAMYSFAISLENMLSILVSSISLSMYSFFCKGMQRERIMQIKRFSMIWGAIIISLAFPAVYIINLFLPLYSGAIPIIYLLFSCQLFYSIVKTVSLNIYKANQQQKLYFIQVVSMCIAALVLDAVLFFIYHTMEFLAIGTVVTAVLWMIVCEISLKMYRFSTLDYIYLILTIILFFACSAYFHPLVGMIVYLLAQVLFVLMFYRRDIHLLKVKICDRVKRKNC